MIHLDVYCKMKKNEKRNNTEDVKKKLILSSNSEQKEYTFEKKEIFRMPNAWNFSVFENLIFKIWNLK